LREHFGVTVTTEYEVARRFFCNGIGSGEVFRWIGSGCVQPIVWLGK
jgi:hypothetical protein